MSERVEEEGRKKNERENRKDFHEGKDQLQRL
jgi:hypothetical protein